MDVGELRVSFLKSGELTERIRRFRTARVIDIKAGDTPVRIPDPSAFSVIHIVPLTAFSTSFRITPKTLAELKSGQHSSLFRPPRASSWNHRINLDGAVAYAPDSNGATLTYTQLYGDGRVEGLDNMTLPARVESERKEIPMGAIEGLTLSYTSQMFRLLNSFEFQPPFYVFLTFVGVEGCTLAAPSGYHFFDMDRESITQNELLLPEVVIEDWEDDLPAKFKPIFDMVWNAAGISHSLSYDDDGKIKYDWRNAY